MYEIVYDFIQHVLFHADSRLVPILTDLSMILIYVALVYMLIWVFRVASRIIKL
jgi:hypothetical protein